MTTWESGRATEYIEDIRAGTKTCEGRLCKGKFAQYKPGDIVHLREDVYDAEGVLLEEIPNRLTVQIVRIETYLDFRTMLEAVGFKKCIPRASDIEAALHEYRRPYSVEDEQAYGVLAIHINVA